MSDLLRHTLATLRYRAGKALDGDGEPFADFRIAPGTRTPAEILAHMGDLFDWALSLADGRHEWHDSEPLPWPQEVERFYTGVAKLDARLAAGPPLCAAGKLFQGPIADALTHTGQIALIRRLAGSPVPGQNYFKAEII